MRESREPDRRRPAAGQGRTGQELREALTALVPPTVSEPGCITYDLHVQVDDPASFHFHEVWRSRQDHAANLAAPHLQDFLARAGDLLDGEIQAAFLRRLTPVSQGS
ncbi:putative quinol monooxygenase [Actinoplanes sp. NEAU-A12]|uniref:Quinol monooxygenase n=1 Tax=Actinoplanes sandaracinus TaxID=3045177 RepID=A0ABT6WY91_9ACTN|nr:putative quinol monooxygenase [Actinoplanes sandaracinus]MDI6104717.1 putative quinol monooxygenase [Actinoplanes sandaracinus]